MSQTRVSWKEVFGNSKELVKQSNRAVANVSRIGYYESAPVVNKGIVFALDKVQDFNDKRAAKHDYCVDSKGNRAAVAAAAPVSTPASAPAPAPVSIDVEALRSMISDLIDSKLGNSQARSVVPAVPEPVFGSSADVQ